MSSNSDVPLLYDVLVLPDTFQLSDITDPPAADDAPAPTSPPTPTSPFHADDPSPDPKGLMHRALGIVEIVSAIVLHLDRPDLAALALTSRLLFPMVVPRLWEIVSYAGALSLLRMLHEEMDEFSPCATPEQSHRFTLYAQHIRQALLVQQDSDVQATHLRPAPLPDVDLQPSQLAILKHLFPKLWLLHVNLKQQTIPRLAHAFITPTMSALTVNALDGSYDWNVESFVSFLDRIKAIDPPLIQVAIGELAHCPEPIKTGIQSLMRQMRSVTDIAMQDFEVGHSLMHDLQDKLKYVSIWSQHLCSLAFTPNLRLSLSMSQLTKLELTVFAHEFVAIAHHLKSPLLRNLHITSGIICTNWCGPAEVAVALSTLALARLEVLSLQIQELNIGLAIEPTEFAFERFNAVLGCSRLKRFSFMFHSRSALALSDADVTTMARAWPLLEQLTIDWKLTSEFLSTPLTILHHLGIAEEIFVEAGGLANPGDLTIQCLTSLKEHCPRLRSIWFKHLTWSEADELDSVEWQASPGRVDLYVGASYLRTTNVSSAYTYLRSLWDDIELEWGEENRSAMQWARVAERFKSSHA
ncbi:hypothetical protein CALVIDRAFT_596793 [Calocera viscosa TUFC12733]|uniref:F-box domain-containing protein n=1 Tax=Calocera viscosa (strain TUFC12733) TaxID=1330018 RepID=A0A167NYG9_CALVF|nr:hypothetical protein CALVIDRAFT_596793 [Calocera viscosa TUFC12733]